MLASGYDERHQVSAGKYKVRRPVSVLPDTFRGYMTSIPHDRDTFHGFSVNGRGVFLCEEGVTRHCVRVYAGQNPSHFANALGVLTIPDGYGKIYAELDCDGKYHGWNIRESKSRRRYALYDRGNMKDSVALLTTGKCVYNDEVCARDDPRLVAFIALVAPVEVLPATAALYPSSPNPRHRAIVVDLPARFAPAGARDGCRQRGAPHGTRCRWWVYDTTQQQPHCQARARSDAALPFRYPARFGRPRKPWPTCHCAWWCACTAATTFGCPVV